MRPVGSRLFEQVTKDGAEATLTYTVALTADPTTGLFVGSLTDLRVKAVNRKPVASALAERMAGGFSIPDVLVDSDGVASGVRGAEKVLEQMDAAGLG